MNDISANSIIKKKKALKIVVNYSSLVHQPNPDFIQYNIMNDITEPSSFSQWPKRLRIKSESSPRWVMSKTLGIAFVAVSLGVDQEV